MITQTLAIVLAALIAGMGADTEMNELTALTLVSAADGVDLTDAAVKIHGRLAFVRVTEPDGTSTTYTVDATEGRVTGCERSRPIDPDIALVRPGVPATPVPESEAMRIADMAARRYAGELASEMTWRVVREDEQHYSLEGHAPGVGDPPRRGLSLSVRVKVRKADGLLQNYAQLPIHREEPIAPKVTRDEAIASACRALKCTQDDLEFKTEPYLFQAQGKLSWEMEVLAKSDGGRGLPPKPSLFRPSVDAVTGELIDIGATKGLARPATPAPVPEAQTVSLAVDAASGEASAPPADRRARHHLPAVGAVRWGRPAVLRRPRRLPAEAKAELGASRCWAVPPPGTAQQRTIAPSGHMVGYLRATTG